MTKAEAMKRFGIKDTDTIHEDGVRHLLRIAETRIKTWSLTESMKAELKQEIEAYKALLND